MKTHSHIARFAATLGIVAPLLLHCSGGQVQIGSDAQKLQTNPDGSATGNGTTCTWEGQTTRVGQSFKSADGCNDCACTSQGAACTERACVGGCNYGGKHYAEGASFPSEDGCNTCGCGANGAVACTKRACVAPDAGPPTCGPNSCGPALGMPNYTCADGTTAGPGACSLQANNQCGWTITACTCQDGTGNVRQVGDSWNDGCNSCACMQNGNVACTKMACTCPPSGTINCMPPVPADRQNVCSGPYHTWVKQNCPGVSFTF